MNTKDVAALTSKIKRDLEGVANPSDEVRHAVNEVARMLGNAEKAHLYWYDISRWRITNCLADFSLNFGCSSGYHMSIIISAGKDIKVEKEDSRSTKEERWAKEIYEMVTGKVWHSLSKWGMKITDAEKMATRLRVRGVQVSDDFADNRLMRDAAKELDRLSKVEAKFKKMEEDLKLADNRLYAAEKKLSYGEVTITTNAAGDCVAVTRNNKNDRIISVIWEKK